MGVHSELSLVPVLAVPRLIQCPLDDLACADDPRRCPNLRLIQFSRLILFLLCSPRRWTDPRLVQSNESLCAFDASPRRCPNLRLVQSCPRTPCLPQGPRRCPDLRLVQWVPCKTAFHLLECRFVIARKQAAHTSERLVYTEYRRFQSVVRTPFRTFVAVFAPLSQ